MDRYLAIVEHGQINLLYTKLRKEEKIKETYEKEKNHLGESTGDSFVIL